MPRVSIKSAQVLRMYIPGAANFVHCARRLVESAGGLTAWDAFGAWTPQAGPTIKEPVQIFEVVTNHYDVLALAGEIGEMFLAENPREQEFLAVVTDRDGATTVRIARNT